MPDYVNESRQLATESRYQANLDRTLSDLASPHGAQAFARGLEDTDFTLGKLLCQMAQLKSDAELGTAARMILMDVVRDSAMSEANRAGSEVAVGYPVSAV